MIKRRISSIFLIVVLCITVTSVLYVVDSELELSNSNDSMSYSTTVNTLSVSCSVGSPGCPDPLNSSSISITI